MIEKDFENNIISKIMYEEFPHDFSICDIDSAVRCFYKENGNYRTRLILFECKYKDEEITKTQLDTLYQLQQNINWTKYDKWSGCFIIKYYDDDNIIVNKFDFDYEKKDYIIYEIKNTNKSKLYSWFSCKDKMEIN